MGTYHEQSASRAGLGEDLAFRRVVEAARARHLLSEIVGRHTRLRRSGAREMVGLCCFHQERTPSLAVNDAKGTFYCHGCGQGGDAIAFLMKAERMGFRQAVEALAGDRFPSVSPAERARRQAADAEGQAARIAAAQAIWQRSLPAADTPAEVYARSRGITMALPPTVRFVETPRWRNAESGEAGPALPAMVCALQDARGLLVGVQCIFLADGGRRKYEHFRGDGSKAKAKLSFGIIAGAALRLGPVGPHLVVCEGPEDGLTLAQQLPGQSVWVCCGTSLMPRLEYPPAVRSVCFAGDNNAAGRRAVGEARTAALARGLGVSETWPEARFKDWNDALRGVEV